MGLAERSSTFERWSGMPVFGGQSLAEGTVRDVPGFGQGIVSDALGV